MLVQAPVPSEQEKHELQRDGHKASMFRQHPEVILGGDRV